MLEGKVRTKNIDASSDAYKLILRTLFKKDFKLSDLPYDPFLKRPIPKVLP